MIYNSRFNLTIEIGFLTNQKIRIDKNPDLRFDNILFKRRFIAALN